MKAYERVDHEDGKDEYKSAEFAKDVTESVEVTVYTLPEKL